MDEKELQNDIRSQVREKLYPLLETYGFDTNGLESVLKWKPLVLIIGNYSSGKSTLINELLGRDIQRTGQAPTDDSFTVITAPGPDDDEYEIPGATLVNDESLPFTSFKAYGERLSSHFQMKLIKSRFLENLAIIDTPGMLDSVTEKGRGYDFPQVVGDFARIADLIVLMFDPHKAGTIKETYTTIRNTLPATSDENRIIFVMSRIDECDNLGDLIRSYGTLCWNLSQMTGRKDIPRIFLTFSTVVAQNTVNLEAWIDERNQLNRKILDAPNLRTNHILSRIDKKTNELKMAVEAMAAFSRGERRLLMKNVKMASVMSLVVFFLMDIIINKITGFPKNTLLSVLFSGQVSFYHFLIPAIGVAGVVFFAWLIFLKWQMPQYKKQCRNSPDNLIVLDTAYKEHTWPRVRNNVLNLLSKTGLNDMRFSHKKNLDKVEKFIKHNLLRYFSSD